MLVHKQLKKCIVHCFILLFITALSNCWYDGKSVLKVLFKLQKNMARIMSMTSGHIQIFDAAVS